LACIVKESSGSFRIQFFDIKKRRLSVRLGAVPVKSVDMVKLRIEQMVASQKSGVSYDADLRQWINSLADPLHERLARVGLVEPRQPAAMMTLKEFLDSFVNRRTDVKPATLEVWRNRLPILCQKQTTHVVHWTRAEAWRSRR